MFGAYDQIVEILSALLTLGTVGVCLYKGFLRRYLFLNLYLFSSLIFVCTFYYVRSAYGYTSLEYFYVYYTADAIQNVIGYLLIASFFDQMLRRSVFQSYVRPTLAIFFLVVVGVSLLFVFENYSRLYSRFVIELQQNMFFVGVLLTFLLWISMSYLRAESRRFVLLVSGLGIYFSAHAATYALRFLFSDLRTIWTRVPPLVYCFMVLLWLYTFLRVPEGEAAAEPVLQPRPRESLVKVKISSE